MVYHVGFSEARTPLVSERPALIYVFSNLSFPAREGQHQNSLLLLRAMREAGYEVSVLALLREPAAFDAVALSCWAGGLRQVVTLPTRLNYPLLLLRHLLPGATRGRLQSGLSRSLDQLLHSQPGALVQLEGIGLLPLASVLKGFTLVLSTTDAWSLRQRRLAQAAGRGLRGAVLRLYAAISARAEGRYMPLAAAVHVVSPVDAQHLQAQVPHARVRAIPLALPLVPVPRMHAGAPTEAGPLLLFWGDIGVLHLAAGLRWLLTEVRSRLRCNGPLQWVVLGRREPGPEWQQAALEGVRFIRWVDDVDALLRSADLVLLPDAQGTGLKNRVVQALACAVPVVGTPSAFEGFDMRDGEQACIRAGADGFAEAIGALLAAPDEAQEMAARGREFVLRHFSVAAMSEAWQALYAEIEIEIGTDAAAAGEQ